MASNASAKAELIGTLLEILLYGIYLVVFCQCLKVLYNKWSEGRPSAILGITALSIFALVTVHMAMDFIRAIQAFTSHPEVPNSAIHYYAIVRRHFDLIKSGCYIAMTILSDGLIGYRTYIVWGRNRYLAIIPVMLLCADIGLGVYAVWLLAQTEPGKNALLGLVTERVKYFYVITLVLNLLCTVLISYKIWRVDSEVGRSSRTARLLKPNTSRIILVIVESAAIYSALLVILIATSATSTPVMLGMLDIISPVIGIVFSMVIIRFSVDRTKWDSLKITTHLNFVSGTFPTVGLESPADLPDVENGLRRDNMHITEKVNVETRIHPQAEFESSFRGSLFSHSKTSIPEFYV